MRDFDPTASEFITSGYLEKSSRKYDAGAIAGPALGGFVSGMFGSDSASSAAAAQTAAAERAAAAQQAQAAQTRQDLMPWTQTGLAANNKLAQALGIGGDMQAPDYGSLTKKFTGADLTSSPGYQFGLLEGQRALDQKAAGAGGYFSGANLKAAQRYGQDYAGTKFNEAFNQDQSSKNQLYNFLGGQSTVGQNSAAGQAAAGQNAANNLSNIYQGLGNAQGAAAIAGGNAWSNAINQGTSAYQNNQFLNALQNRSGSQYTNNPYGSGYQSDSPYALWGNS